jgi:hypothetical protein
MRVDYETPITIAFWQHSVGRGTLILEYPVVTREWGSLRRRVDGLIVLDGEFEQCLWNKAPDMTGRPVMVIQTKAHRTDPVVIGQAVLSPILLRRRHPSIGRVQSVLLSPQPEPSVSGLLRRNRVREVTVQGPDVKLRPAQYKQVADSHLSRLHKRLGGEMLLGVRLPAEPSTRPILRLDALILPDRPSKVTQTEVERVAYQLIPAGRAIAVVSTQGALGMGISGFALVAQHLLTVAGAEQAEAIAVIGREDSAVQFALKHFRGVSTELVA